MPFCLFLHKRTGHWQVQVRWKGKPLHCGSSLCKVEATIIRNVMLGKLYGSLVNYWNVLSKRGTRLQKALLEAREVSESIEPIGHEKKLYTLPSPDTNLPGSLGSALDSILKASEKKKDV